MNVAYDYLHCKYLGADQYMYAAVLTRLCYHVLPATPLANIQTVWKAIVEEYKRQNVPVRFRYLNSLRMFIRQKGPPKLRGKGAEIKYLAGPMAAVWQRFQNNALVMHKEISLMLRLNEFLENILTDHRGNFSLGDDAARFEEGMQKMLVLQSKVAADLAEAGSPIMSITEKSHFLQHSAMLSKYLSPRMVRAFAGEDQQKRVQTLGKASVKGLGPKTACFKMVTRYRLALHFRFIQHG